MRRTIALAICLLIAVPSVAAKGWAEAPRQVDHSGDAFGFRIDSTTQDDTIIFAYSAVLARLDIDLVDVASATLDLQSVVEYRDLDGDLALGPTDERIATLDLAARPGATVELTPSATGVAYTAFIPLPQPDGAVAPDPEPGFSEPGLEVRMRVVEQPITTATGFLLPSEVGIEATLVDIEATRPDSRFALVMALTGNGDLTTTTDSVQIDSEETTFFARGQDSAGPVAVWHSADTGAIALDLPRVGAPASAAFGVDAFTFEDIADAVVGSWPLFVAGTAGALAIAGGPMLWRLRGRE